MMMEDKHFIIIVADDFNIHVEWYSNGFLVYIEVMAFNLEMRWEQGC